VDDAVLAINFQSAQLIKNNPGFPDDNTVTGNTVNVPGPGRGTPPPGVIPEPGTMALLGAGLIAVGLFKIRARQ
jgi:hypothetical protein